MKNYIVAIHRTWVGRKCEPYTLRNRNCHILFCLRLKIDTVFIRIKGDLMKCAVYM